MMERPDSKELVCALKYEFTASNNHSKYETLTVGLRMALAMNIEQSLSERRLQCHFFVTLRDLLNEMKKI